MFANFDLLYIHDTFVRELPHQPQSVLITGGAGFIGSNFTRFILSRYRPSKACVVYDSLTYAGNLENLDDLKGEFVFVHGDICDTELAARTLAEYEVDTVVHFAAESHVDRSILGPLVFTRTNVLGTHSLLEACRKAGVQRFIHVSTDEVYGSLGPDGFFTETTPLDPTSPYSASKAASDQIVLAYYKTFGMEAIVTRCSNNYGPYQFPEKLIPLMITNALREMRLPVYGDGKNVRDWIHALDHASAIYAVLQHGKAGEVYNIGGSNERTNIDIVQLILSILGKTDGLIEYVKDRPAHDRRYAIDSTKLQTELGWKPAISFEQGMKETVDWYLANEPWWRRVMSGEYQNYYTRQYIER